MALRSEVSDLLAGFEKRMKFINIVRYLWDYKYPDHIRMMMPNRVILDNTIVAVLVYIKDRTLGTEQTCTLADIERFLEDFSIVLPNSKRINPKTLARYIIVDVLQHGGVMEEYETFNSATEKFEPMAIRLINEEKGCYYLTDDGFDFLFRTKEIESELDYSVTRFRMKEYMKRDNYEAALEDSREMVSRIRNMKLSMDTFLLRCREDISKVTVDYYETVISRFRKLLEDEYRELLEIQSAAEDRARQTDEAIRNGLASEDMQKRKEALREIIDNISLTIDEQRALINKKTTLSQDYHTLIHDSFAVKRFERLNFEREIMIPLRETDERLGDAAKFLLFMFTKPEFEKRFGVESFYAPPGKITEDEENNGIDISEENTDSELQIAERNSRYRNIIISLFAFINNKNHFKISEFIDALRVSELKEFCIENTLPSVLLALFALQTIDIESWRTGEQFSVIPSGEFELAWCLKGVPEDCVQMKTLNFSRTNNEFSFAVQYDGYEYKINITDFDVEVEW